MNYKYKYLKIYILLNLICFLRIVYSFNIVMKNDKKSMTEMVDTINYQLTNKELNVEFDDNNYDIDCNGRNHYYILNSISFNGKNNTIFNYQYSKKGSFYIHFNAGLVDKKVIFQNIKFLNYDSFHDDNSNLFTIETEDETDRYTIEFNNCIFDNIKGIISNIKITCLKSVQSTPQIIFKNCKFM